MLELIALSYSPWSLKARWALDHQGVNYKYSEYMPMFGEPALKLRTKSWGSRVTIPILIGDGVLLKDSFEIARFAHSKGDGTLFPTPHEGTGHRRVTV
jgi:glutathione S-transferase